MSIFFKRNDFRTDYQKRPFDGYKSVVDKLDEPTKQKLDRQRQKGMLIIVVFVTLLVIILAVTGIGVDKTKSRSGNPFVDKEQITIECFGDSFTEGFTVGEGGIAGTAEITYPAQLEERLPVLFQEDGNQYRFRELKVKNFGQAGSILQNGTGSRLSGAADIVLILYTANNFITGAEYVDTLENNIAMIQKQGAQVFVLNYPVKKGSVYEDKFEQANNYIESAAKTMEVPLIDLHAYFSENLEYPEEELFGADQEHLTDLGYALMGNFAAESVHEYYYDRY